MENLGEKHRFFDNRDHRQDSPRIILVDLMNMMSQKMEVARKQNLFNSKHLIAVIKYLTLSQVRSRQIHVLVGLDLITITDLNYRTISPNLITGSNDRSKATFN